jgi:hypothetical protein
VRDEAGVGAWAAARVCFGLGLAFIRGRGEIPKIPLRGGDPLPDDNVHRRRSYSQWLTCGAGKGGAHLQPEAGNNWPLHGVS